MNAKWVMRFVDVLIVLFALIILASLVQVGGSIAGDTFATVGWTASGPEIEAATLGGAARFTMRTGTLSVEGMGATSALYWIARLTVLGLMMAAFLQLRGVLARIARSEVFQAANIAALRKIGWFLLTGSLISILATTLIQISILNALPPLEGVVVHPSLSRSVDGARNIWLDYDPPIVPLLMALIAFLASSAFRAGMGFREDSESVV